MLPDYPAVKAFAHSAILRAVKNQIAREEPLLSDIHHSTIHEGRTASLTRADASSDDIAFKTSTATSTMPREQMRRITVEQLQEHVVTLASQFAEDQATAMLEEISRVVEGVGNMVSATELGAKEAFLEMQRKIDMEFDPETLEPEGLTLVVHPTQMKRLMELTAEWENDPRFRAEQQRIREQKIEEWRARENRRQLVD